MAVYYLRTGAPNTAGTVNLNSTTLWAEQTGAFPPGAGATGTTLGSPLYANSANEFVIDANSGGVGSSTANSLQLTVTSNLTIANLSFGVSNVSINGVVNTSTKAYLNISAGVNLSVTEALQLACGSMASTVGALRLNTNTTGKLVILKNLYLGVHNLTSAVLGQSNANFSLDGIQKSIIEFSGSNPCLLNSNSVGSRTGGVNSAFLTFNVITATPLASSLEIQFNKSGSTAFIPGLVSSGIRMYNPSETTFTITSNYDATAKSAAPSRYNSILFTNFTVNGTKPINFVTDSKEIVFGPLEYIHSNSTNITFTNAGSSFKINAISNGNFTGAKGYIQLISNAIIEIYQSLNLVNCTTLTNPGIVRGSGTLKFVGTTNGTITTSSKTEAVSFANAGSTGWNAQCFADISIEINKTSGATLTFNDNVSDLNISRFMVYKTTAISVPTFKHISGQLICDELFIFGSGASNYYDFTGNATFNTGNKILLFVSNKITISSTVLKTNQLEISPKTLSGGAIVTAPAALYNATILGDKGFTVNDFIHTSSTANLAGVISNVILSNNSAAVYTVNNSITMLGLATRRANLRGDTASVINLPTTSASTTTLTTTSSPALTIRHYVSQLPTNPGLFKRTPSPTFTGSDITIPSSFAKISGGAANTWTLNRNVGSITARPFEAGIPAVFKYTGLEASLNINYVNTFDIDSSGIGTTTIKANNSYQNRIGIPSPNLWRTVNWDSLNPLLPLVTVAYIE
jgi:hypothetical protein